VLARKYQTHTSFSSIAIKERIMPVDILDTVLEGGHLSMGGVLEIRYPGGHKNMSP
jgi:hypothetical protein